MSLNWQTFIIVCALAVGDSAVADEPPRSKTYCNPLSIPNYPIGRLARNISVGDADPDWMWRLGYQQQFRELADVSALWFDNKWYLYPSVDMAWVSDDFGATWKHQPLNVRDIGYAPTIVQHKDKFLLMASESPIYVADAPLGPFKELGRIKLDRSSTIPGLADPMLFSDADHRLFFYWGCSPTGGIWGVELDSTDPTKAIGAPKELIPFRPNEFPWEAVGEWNQNPTTGWMEGAWMLKHRGRYYLTYSAGGTENRTYAVGCYVGDSPLGPFRPQKRNPVLRTIDGLVTGTAHGCVVAGPSEELWAFYTIKAGVVHAFERRIGMDRADIDVDGELVVHGATSLPQSLPNSPDTKNGNSHPGWLPMNTDLRTIGSTNAPNLEGRFAVDNDLRTWWQPAESDRQPTLTTRFMSPSKIHAARIVWRDVGLDTKQGILPGPIRYRVELETRKDQWSTIIDRSESNDDLLIDYRECTPTIGTRARLVILEWPKGIIPSVVELTLFGTTATTN